MLLSHLWSNAPSALRRAPPSLLLVGGLHLVVLWALINGLQIHNNAVTPPPDMTTTMIDKPITPVETPVRGDPPRTDFHLTVPTPPTIPLPPDDPSPTLHVDSVLIPTITQSGGTVLPQPVIAAAGVDPRRPLTQPPYPLSSIRGGEEGALSLQVLVGVDGHVREAQVARSSGSERLDQAAVTEAKQRWRLRPATRDGVPFEQWLTLRVVFKLENR